MSLQAITTLDDLSLAMLLCLIAREHAIITTESDDIESTTRRIEAAGKECFGLRTATIACDSTLSVDDFTRGLLLDRETSESPTFKSSKVIADVVIATNLADADFAVQMRVFELLQKKRIYTHTEVYSVPKTFLFIVVTSQDSPPLINQLNDIVAVAHDHYEEDYETSDDVLRTSSLETTFPPQVIDSLRKQVDNVAISVDVQRYIWDVVVFLRRHRAVAGGITPVATRLLEHLTRCFAILHGSKFVTPSFVPLAVKKSYPHRIRVIDPENDRSLRYGGDVAAVREYLADLTVDDVIEEVLASVEVPI